LPIHTALLLNLGQQAQELGAPARSLAYQSLEKARSLASSVAPAPMYVEALDALAQLYENEQRVTEALELTRQALVVAHGLPASALAELSVALEWRTGRLRRGLGQFDTALAAYQRAVEQIEALRPDMPIEFDDGSSSFRKLFEPVYMGLVDSLLQSADNGSADLTTDFLRRARDAAELIKQSELQDYLGDRCTLDTVKGGSATVIPTGTAVLYPIIFPDRIELLLENSAGINRFTTRIDGAIVRATANGFASVLRNGGADYLPQARQLYNWILRPIESALVAHHIDTVVVVPDGALRLVPIGALHDGKKFAIERFAISTVTGMSMTNTTASSIGKYNSLVAGASEFGGAIEKLLLTQSGREMAKDVTGLSAASGATRGRMLRSPVVNRAASVTRSQVEVMRDAMALPGVGHEVELVGSLLVGTSMLNEQFSAASFSQAASSGNYNIVHVASHGVFGGSADSSFLLAYDDLLTLDRIQTLLTGEQFRRRPIELLTLSACETAEGNDRAPLGISGAAIKARAKSVLGTLWPVDDEAAVQVMGDFYRSITQKHMSKAQALRQAQLELIHTKTLHHPVFWAPFSLIGNWL
jgi:CHAT domain-containing protein